MWDAVSDAEYYRIYRGGVNVGDTRWRNFDVCDQWSDIPDEVTGEYPCAASHIYRPVVWIFAHDCLVSYSCSFVTEGFSYFYDVKACRIDHNGAEVCSDDFSNTVVYTAAPYYCYDNGTRVSC
jgi:hypothetical protein